MTLSARRHRPVRRVARRAVGLGAVIDGDVLVAIRAGRRRLLLGRVRRMAIGTLLVPAALRLRGGSSRRCAACRAVRGTRDRRRVPWCARPSVRSGIDRRSSQPRPSVRAPDGTSRRRPPRSQLCGAGWKVDPRGTSCSPRSRSRAEDPGAERGTPCTAGSMDPRLIVAALAGVLRHLGLLVESVAAVAIVLRRAARGVASIANVGMAFLAQRQRRPIEPGDFDRMALPTLHVLLEMDQVAFAPPEVLPRLRDRHGRPWFHAAVAAEEHERKHQPSHHNPEWQRRQGSSVDLLLLLDQPAGCGLPPMPPTSWQETQSISPAPPWQLAHEIGSRRAAAPCRLDCNPTQPAGCGLPRAEAVRPRTARDTAGRSPSRGTSRRARIRLRLELVARDEVRAMDPFEPRPRELEALRERRNARTVAGGAVLLEVTGRAQSRAAQRPALRASARSPARAPVARRPHLFGLEVLMAAAARAQIEVGGVLVAAEALGHVGRIAAVAPPRSGSATQPPASSFT